MLVHGQLLEAVGSIGLLRRSNSNVEITVVDETSKEEISVYSYVETLDLSHCFSPLTFLLVGDC